MKKVLIIGGSGSLAGVVIDALKDISDVSLTLFVRSQKRLSRQRISDCKIIEGDALNKEDLRDAVSGQHIVYINLAGDLETMTRNIVSAMDETGVKRVVAISSIGIYETPLKSVLKPYRKLADIIEESGLDYTILRPDWFTDDSEINYILTRKGQPEKGTAISRKSIAAFVATIVAHPELHVGENLGISRPD